MSDYVSAQTQKIIPQTQNIIPQSQNIIPQSQNMIPQSHMSAQSDNRNLNKMRVERKKKTCNDPECKLRGPCSEEDCGICQFCQNRNLK